MKTPYDDALRFVLKCADDAQKSIREDKNFSIRVEAVMWGALIVVAYANLCLFIFATPSMMWFRWMGMSFIKYNLEQRQYMLDRANEYRKLQKEWRGHK